MTAVIVIIFLFIGDAWFALRGPSFLGSVSIYPILFIITLATASLYAYRSNDKECLTAAVAMVIHFVAHQVVWTSTYSYWLLSLVYAAFSFYFLATSLYRWQIVIGGLYLLCSLAGVMNWLGFIPSHFERSYQFIAWSYPDVIALAGHAANVVLGMGSGDTGKQVRAFFGGLKMEPAERLHYLSRRVFGL